MSAVDRATGPAAARLLAGLIDDAAVFPPGDAPLAEAVPAHERHRGAWYAPTVGPFLCPAGRVDELGAVLGRRPPATAPLEVALVVRGVGATGPAVEALAGVERARLAGVELAPAYGGDAAAVARQALEELAEVVPPDVPAALEVPRGAASERVLDTLAGAAGGAGGSWRRPAPVRAKLRTGGLEPGAYPSEREVAGFLQGCARRGLACKLTAGLHHAVRRTAPGSRFEEHGYLNVLLAAAAASEGGEEGALAAILAERDRAAVAEAVLALGEPAAARARALVTSFGACSIAEPLADAVALGLLHAP